MIRDSALWFSRSDRFKDKLEGSITATDLKERQASYRSALGTAADSEENAIAEAALACRALAGKNSRQAYYVSCWHENDVESIGMWDLYCPGDEPAVAVKTKFSHLKESLEAVLRPIQFSRVHYIDYTNGSIPNGNSAFPFIYKSKSLAHEQEVRAVLNYLEQVPIDELLDPNLVYPDGLNVAVDLPRLIDSLYVRPGVAVGEVTTLLSKYGRSFPIFPSKTEAAPIF